MPLETTGSGASLIFLVDTDDGRQLTLEGEDALVGLTLTGDGLTLDIERPQRRQVRQFQEFGDHRRNGADATVGGLVAGDDELDFTLDGAQRAGQDVGGLDRVGACRASSWMWIALSAPIDSALRIASVALAGPAVSTVTSPPLASF